MTGFIYIVLNFVPFLLQVFVFGKDKDRLGIYICNSLCIAMSVFTFFMEWIVYKAAGSFSNYLKKSIFNYFDIPMCFFQIFYSIHRMIDTGGEVLPEVWHSDLKLTYHIDHVIILSVSNFVITMFNLT